MDSNLSDKIKDIEKNATTKKSTIKVTVAPMEKQDKKKAPQSKKVAEPKKIEEPKFRDEWDEGEETGLKVTGIVFITEIMVMLALISACCVKFLFGL